MAQGKERTKEEVMALIEPMLQYLKIGMSEARAAEVCAINRDRLYAYKKKFPEVQTKLQQAKSEYLIAPHRTLAEAAAKEWKPAVEVLKRKDRKEWSEQTNVDVTTQGEKINIINPVPRPTNEKGD